MNGSVSTKVSNSEVTGAHEHYMLVPVTPESFELGSKALLFEEAAWARLASPCLPTHFDFFSPKTLATRNTRRIDSIATIATSKKPGKATLDILSKGVPLIRNSWALSVSSM